MIFNIDIIKDILQLIGLFVVATALIMSGYWIKKQIDSLMQKIIARFRK